MRKAALLFALFLAVFAPVLPAQVQTKQVQTRRTGNDIRDLEAYRLKFVQWSDVLTDPESSEMLKNVLLRDVRLSVEDESALRAELLTFKNNLDAAASAHAATITKGKPVEDFRPMRDKIVTDEVNRINGLMSDNGVKLLQYIQKQKSRMQIVTTGGAN
jgi:hypothetical protein